MKLVIASLFAIAMAIFSLPATTLGAPALQRVVPRYDFRPKVGATKFVTIALPSPQPSAIGNVVFLPNGTAYFTDAKQNEIASFTSSGVYTRIPVPHAFIGDSLLYDRGVFWMSGDVGVVKVTPDGSRRHWFALAVSGSVTYVQSLAAGPDGAMYALALVYAKGGGAVTYMLFRISANDSVTMMPLPVIPNGGRAAVFGADKRLYFGYTDTAGRAGVARLESNGSLTLFPIAGSYQTASYVVSRGNIYFNDLYDANGSIDGKLGRITPAGIVSITAYPTISNPGTDPSTQPSSLSVDHGGNLWVAVNNVFYDKEDFLYQFNTYTGHFNGPYLTGLPNAFYGGPVVSPDNNVWIGLAGTTNDNLGEPIGFGIFLRGV